MDFDDFFVWEWDFDMPDLSELNLVALVMGLIGGFIGVYVAGSMYAGLFIKVLGFVIWTFASYLLVDAMGLGK